MGKLEDDVRELIISRYDTLINFARHIGLSERTLYSALSKGLRKTTLSTIIPICTGLGIDPVDIAEGQLSFSANMPAPVFVPLFGSIAAGTPIEMQQADDMFPIPASLHEAHPESFMLRVKGNSMNKVLPDGFLALIDPVDSVDVSGQIYAVAIGANSATVKRVILHDNGFTLQPDSNDPTYQSQLYDYSKPHAETVSVIGRVVWWCPPADSPSSE